MHKIIIAFFNTLFVTFNNYYKTSLREATSYNNNIYNNNMKSFSTDSYVLKAFNMSWIYNKL